MEVDIDTMKYPQLSELQERIDTKVAEMREIGGPALREKFTEEAAEYGLTVEEVMQVIKPRRGRPPKTDD